MNRTELFCERLKELGALPCGTECFIFIGERLVSVYDDLTVYPGAKAVSWQVKVYSLASGRQLDRVCIHRGRFRSRDEALDEIGRFRLRGEGLLFLIAPKGFSYDVVGHIWRNDLDPDGEASYEEQRREARLRLLAVTGREYGGEPDLRRCRPNDPAVKLFSENGITAANRLFPFALVSGSSVLYLSGDKASWHYERSLLRSGCEGSYDGIAPAFVCDFYSPEWSEFGEIAYKRVGSGLCRRA